MNWVKLVVFSISVFGAINIACIIYNAIEKVMDNRAWKKFMSR